MRLMVHVADDPDLLVRPQYMFQLMILSQSQLVTLAGRAEHPDSGAVCHSIASKPAETIIQ